MTGGRWVRTGEIKVAVRGREAAVIQGLGITLNGHKHIKCPYPDHDDKHPSWRLSRGGVVMCSCLQSQKPHTVFDVAMKMRGIDFDQAKIAVAEIIGREDLIHQSNPGCSLHAYADYKRLPAAFLVELGIKEVAGRFDKPELLIPYRDESGALLTTRRRVSLTRKPHTLHEKGAGLSLYGLDRLEELRRHGFGFLVEGESDAQSLWLTGFPALGTPGSGTFSDGIIGDHLDGNFRFYVVQEPDAGGSQLVERVARSKIAKRARIMRLEGGAKDPSELWISCNGSREQFAAEIRKAMEKSEPCPAPRDAEPLTTAATTDGAVWGEPDMGVLRLHRREPPELPLDAFGLWEDWIVTAAANAACPADYVAAPLLAAVSTLIGHARWAQATPGWKEPPHLWIGVVGDSGNGKSPGADCLMRDVLPEIERRMMVDFPELLRDWRSNVEFDSAAEDRWKSEVRDAQKNGRAPPRPPVSTAGPEPQSPRLRQYDVTVEKVASLLAGSAPKGLLIVRDELAGWIEGMTAYNPAGRSFWVEAYGGRPYSVERQKHQDPINIPRNAVAVYGGTQPDKLSLLMREADDGLFARFLWAWPDPVPFRLGRETPETQRVIAAFERLRELGLRGGDPPSPVMVPLTARGQGSLEEFAREMQDRQRQAAGLMRSAYGKARGDALRLALNLEYLWWCGQEGFEPPPGIISDRAFAAATMLVGDYFMPMAERVYGDAASSQADRNAATLARWIIKERPTEVHIRHLQRKGRLPGLKTAHDITAAAGVLVEAEWLRAPARNESFGGRAREVYTINPKVWETKL